METWPAQAAPKAALKMNRKNIHSRAYNKRKVECKNQGMDHEQCLVEARKAGQAAVQQAINDAILGEHVD